MSEDPRQVELLQCLQCGHQQMGLEKYDEALMEFLYPDDATCDAVRSNPGIYPGIVQFAQEYLNSCDGINVLDLGGGEGDFLHYLSSSKEIIPPFKKFVLCDFKSRPPENKIPNVEVRKIDFNCMGNHLDDLPQLDINFVFCIYTLEHLLNPREFLENVFQVNDAFYFYIEVPATELLSIEDSPTRLHPTHVQYFNLPNLVSLLDDIGFDVIKAENAIIFGAPSLKVLVKKGPKLETSTVRLLRNEKERYRYIYQTITERMETEQVALWGIGQEFRDLVFHFEHLKELIRQGRILLIDAGLFGHRIEGSKIRKPSEIVLETTLDTIIIMPKLSATRKVICENATELGIRENIILDPCQTFELDQK